MMIRRWALLLLILTAGNVQAQSDATITLDVKCSYESSLTLYQDLLGPDLSGRIADLPFISDTLIVLQVKDPTLKPYRLMDPGKLVIQEFYLEPGDSLIFRFDMNTGESWFTYDKLGYETALNVADKLIFAEYTQLRGAQGMPWSSFQRVADRAAEEFRDSISMYLQSLRSSKRSKLIEDRLELVPLRAKLHYLANNDWGDETKASLYSEQLPLFSSISSQKLDQNSELPDVISEWIGMLNFRDFNCELAAGTASIAAALPQIKSRTRDLVLRALIKEQLRDRSEADDLASADSLVRVYPFSDAVIRQAHDKYIEQKRKLVAGSLAPDFELPDTNGVYRKLSDHRGKVVLIDFWGTWCAPCLAELPHLKMLAREFADTDLVILGVALEGRAVSRWKAFIKKKKLDWQHVYGEGQFWNPVVKTYAIPGVPTYVLIGRDGHIIDSNAPRPSSDQLKPLIEQALKTKAD